MTVHGAAGGQVPSMRRRAVVSRQRCMASRRSAGSRTRLPGALGAPSGPASCSPAEQRLPSRCAARRRSVVIPMTYASHWRHRPCSIDRSGTSPVGGPQRGGLLVTRNTAPELNPSDDPFGGYQTEGFFDEVFSADGEVRPPYRSLVARLRAILARRARPPRAPARRDLPEPRHHLQRLRRSRRASSGCGRWTWSRASFPPRSGRRSSAGSSSGSRRSTSSSTTSTSARRPRSPTASCRARSSCRPTASSARRSASRCRTPRAAWSSGVDLVRDGDGVYRVLEDNLRTPSGISYVLENRATLTRVLPLAFAQHRVRPVSPLSGVAADGAPQRRTGGRGQPARRRADAGRVQLGLLRARVPRAPDGRRARRGPRPRGRRARRLPAHDARARARRRRLPPDRRRLPRPGASSAATRRSASPASSNAARAGNVTIANAIGNGVADDKAIYAYVPALIKYYLNEEPILPNVETYLLWQPEQREAALARLDQLVIKPVAASGGYGIVIGPRASDEQLAHCRRQIEDEPARLHRAGGDLALAPPDVPRRPASKARHIDLRPVRPVRRARRGDSRAASRAWRCRRARSW